MDAKLVPARVRVNQLSPGAATESARSAEADAATGSAPAMGRQAESGAAKARDPVYQEASDPDSRAMASKAIPPARDWLARGFRATADLRGLAAALVARSPTEDPP